jgi:hypothetical protein
MPGEQQHAGEADDLVIGQPLAVDLGGGELADQVIGRLLAAPPDVGQQVLIHLAHGRRDRVDEFLGGKDRGVHGLLVEQRLGLQAELGPVGCRHPEQLRDHGDREGIGENVSEEKVAGSDRIRATSA